MSEKTLFYRKIDDITRTKIANATVKIVDLMHERGLEPWECFIVINTLYEEFPLEYLIGDKNGES